MTLNRCVYLLKDVVMAACHLVRRKSNYPFLGQREYQANMGKLEFATRAQPKAIYVVLKYDRGMKKKLKLDSSTSEFLLNPATHELWILANYRMSYYEGFHQKDVDDDKKPQGSSYTSTENKWMTLKGLRWYVNIKYYQHY